MGVGTLQTLQHKITYRWDYSGLVKTLFITTTPASLESQLADYFGPAAHEVTILDTEPAQ